MVIKLVLPMPPTANHIWKKNGSKFYLAPEYQKFKETVKRICESTGSPFIEGRLDMAVELHFDNKRKNDISNRVKALEDSLKGIAFEDDSQIDKLYIKRGNPSVTGSSWCFVVIQSI